MEINLKTMEVKFGEYELRNLDAKIDYEAIYKLKEVGK